MLNISLTSIDKAEALRYMGWRGKPDKAMQVLMEECETLVRQTAQPKMTFRVVPLVKTENGLFAEKLPLAGKDIAKLLQDCEKVILMAATLSAQTDTLIQRTQVQDLTRALAIDALASAGIEQVCQKAEQIFHAQLSQWYFTWRFSPGYGDLPLHIQTELLTMLDAGKRIGLTVTPECILIPRKSVTAIIGLSKTPLQKGTRGCTTCSMRESCAYRQQGISCAM